MSINSLDRRQFPYLHECWELRFFVIQLARSDIRQKYRKSFIGVLWIFLLPLTLTLMMTLVMSSVFNQEPGTYSTYVLAGLIAWDFIVQCALAGGQIFVQSEGYIKQYKRPLFVYLLRVVLVNSVSLVSGTIGLVLWAILFNSYIPGIEIFALLGAWLIGVLTALPLAGLLGFITTKFRDFGQLTLLTFQMLWYVSPVFISKSAFESNGSLQVFMHANPVYHYLELYRSPIMENQMPTLNNVLMALLPAILLWPIFVLRLKIAERKLIYHI